MDHGILAWRNHTARVFVDDEVQGGSCAVRAHHIPCSGAGNNSVEIAGISLRFGKALPAALGASVVIGKLRGRPVMSVDDGFGLHGHLVNRSISKIDQLLGMPERKIGVIPNMTGIGARSGVTCRHRRRERGIWNRAGPSAIADSLKLA